MHGRSLFIWSTKLGQHATLCLFILGLNKAFHTTDSVVRSVTKQRFGTRIKIMFKHSLEASAHPHTTASKRGHRLCDGHKYLKKKKKKKE